MSAGRRRRSVSTYPLSVALLGPTFAMRNKNGRSKQSTYVRGEVNQNRKRERKIVTVLGVAHRQRECSGRGKATRCCAGLLTGRKRRALAIIRTHGGE